MLVWLVCVALSALAAAPAVLPAAQQVPLGQHVAGDFAVKSIREPAISPAVSAWEDNGDVDEEEVKRLEEEEVKRLGAQLVPAPQPAPVPAPQPATVGLNAGHYPNLKKQTKGNMRRAKRAAA